MRIERFFLIGMTLTACGGSDDTNATDGGTRVDGSVATDGAIITDGGIATDAAALDATSPDAGTDAGATQCESHTVSCVDESIARLDLFDTENDAEITDESVDATEFRTLIDATAGGLAPTEAFVYARFEDTGLMRVTLDDEESFESTDWDIAFRRFVIRLNSGISGPSCVTVARTSPSTDFETLDAVPDGLSYRVEQYFTDTCEYVPDSSGLDSPGVAMASFWTYPGCVTMSGNVYVVQLANGRHVKLQVLSYYSPENQELCNETGSVNAPSGAGALRIRWKFLD